MTEIEKEKIANTPSHTGCAECCDSGSNKRALSTRLILLCISLISLVISFVMQEADIAHRAGIEVLHLLDPALVAVVICGLPVISSAIHALKHKRISASLLISIAVFACLTLQVLSFLGLSDADSGHGHEESFIFVAGEITFILTIGEFLEDLAFVRSGKKLQGFRLIKEKNGKSLFDKWSSFIIPLTLALSLFTALFCVFVFSLTIQESVVRAITVLVVFCPCSLALASPTGLGAASYALHRRGINITSPETFENLAANKPIDDEGAIDITDELCAFSKKVFTTIRISLVLSLGINAFSALLSIFGFVAPLAAALIHNLSIVAVILNSSLLFLHAKKVAKKE